MKQDADKETGEGGSDALESARNGLVLAYNSLLDCATPVQMGNYQSPRDAEKESNVLDVEEVIRESEEKDLEENGSLFR